MIFSATAIANFSVKYNGIAITVVLIFESWQSHKSRRCKPLSVCSNYWFMSSNLLIWTFFADDLVLQLLKMKQKKEPQPTIVFCNKASTSYFVADLLNDHDIPHVHMHGKMLQEVIYLIYLSEVRFSFRFRFKCFIEEQQYVCIFMTV